MIIDWVIIAYYIGLKTNYILIILEAVGRFVP